MIRALSLLIALLFAAPAFADPAQRDIHPALYQVRYADSTLYLFGTVHVRRPGSPWGGAEAIAALDEADEVWTEILFTPESEAQAQLLVLRLGLATEDRPLSSWLTADESSRLDALTQRLGVPRARLEMMQPWLAGLTLTMLPIMQNGFDPNSGVDRAVDAVGDASGKRMRAFETAEEQLRFIAGLSAEVQREMLLDAIDETEKGPATLLSLTSAWERGDLEVIERLVVEETRGEYPELYEVLFRRRNAAWIEVLRRELEDDDVEFVAVGAGHLVGEEGLVEMLRARGFTVERVASR